MLPQLNKCLLNEPPQGIKKGLMKFSQLFYEETQMGKGTLVPFC